MLFDPDDFIAGKALRVLEEWKVLEMFPGMFHLIGSAAVFRCENRQNYSFLDQILNIIEQNATKANLTDLYLLRDVLEKVISDRKKRYQVVGRIQELIKAVELGDIVE